MSTTVSGTSADLMGFILHCRSGHVSSRQTAFLATRSCPLCPPTSSKTGIDTALDGQRHATNATWLDTARPLKSHAPASERIVQPHIQRLCEQHLHTRRPAGTRPCSTSHCTHVGNRSWSMRQAGVVAVLMPARQRPHRHRRRPQRDLSRPGKRSLVRTSPPAYSARAGEPMVGDAR